MRAWSFLVALACIFTLPQCGAIRQFEAQQKADEHKQRVQDAIASCHNLLGDSRLDPIRGVIAIEGRPDLAMLSDTSFITEEQRPAVNALQSIINQCRANLARADAKLAGLSEEVSLDDARLRLYNRQITIGDYNQAKLDIAVALTERAAGTQAKSVAAATPGRDVPAPSAPRGSGQGARSGSMLLGNGTGFVVSDGGHVLTNDHVVAKCSSVRVRLPGSTDDLTASILARDEHNDLALLVLPVRASSVASFRSGKAVRQGETVVALGFPLADVLASGVKVTTGSVSALAGLDDDSRFLQFSAPIQPGNSGGPVLDASGNVIGVTRSSLSNIKVTEATGGAIPQNLNFAIKNAVSTTFMEKNGVAYRSASSTNAYDPADVAERAKAFTVYIGCWS